jgi:hypothetical protein
VKPDLQFSVLCDDVRREDNGKLILIGLFEMVAGLSYPMVYPGMAIVNRWCNGDGLYQQRVRLVDADNKVLIETSDNAVELAEMRSTVTVVTLLRNVQVPRPGSYWVEILLDGDLKQRYSLVAAQVGPPQGPIGA